MDEENNILELLSVMANILQIATYIDAQNIASNTDIMKALEAQNQQYLDRILKKIDDIYEKQQEILKRLNEEE